MNSKKVVRFSDNKLPAKTNQKKRNNKNPNNFNANNNKKCTANSLAVTGTINVKQGQPVNEFKERIRIVVCLRSKNTPKTLNEWENLLRRREVLTTPHRNFSIPKNNWFSNGFSWIVPTHLFGRTTIEINLNPSALLPAGFTLEVFLRSTSILKEIPAHQTLAAGGKFTFDVEWNPIAELLRATPIFATSKFSSGESTPIR